MRNSINDTDDLIRAARREMHRTEDDQFETAQEKSLAWLYRIDRLQRTRRQMTGRYLPHSDGHVYIYDVEWDRWVRWP